MCNCSKCPTDEQNAYVFLQNLFKKVLRCKKIELKYIVKIYLTVFGPILSAGLADSTIFINLPDGVCVFR
jgi:hypothetical protein